MKVMRSKKEGSQCADCGAVISIGDPIAYYGPGRVYGLNCHESPQTQKHLATLLEIEQLADILPSERQPTEWCIKLGFDDSNEVQAELLKYRYAELRGNWLILRSPRSTGLAVTRAWATSMAEKHGGEALPYWVEED